MALACGLLLVDYEYTDKKAFFRVAKMALKRDFTHLIDVLQELLQQMKCSLDELSLIHI